MKNALFVILILLMLCAAEPRLCSAEAIPVAVALREAEERWHIIEPELFASDATARKHVGVWVRCSGPPISLQAPVTIKLASGVIVRLTKLQGTDRSELAAFHKPPSVVIVYGPILSINPSTYTVTIKAVSTTFKQ